MTAQRPYIEFKENKGQWHENVLYKAKLPAGELFLEQQGLTYQFFKEEDLHRIEELHHNFITHPTAKDSIVNLHAFKVNFLNSNNNSILRPSILRPDYENYFIGNDPKKWASNITKYEEVVYENIYEHTNLKFYLKEGVFKYDFEVLPEGDPENIALEFDGVEDIFIKNGNLHIQTSVNEIIEQKPYAYQQINGKEKAVKCYFVLKGTTLTFDFPKGYNKNYPLIIDPALIFASYSGATVDNWGFTSTFNDLGNLYGGGVSFGVGYPTTTGAIQTTFGGGALDISISKFSPNGSMLEYSTYFGGGNSEYPHSLIVNSNDELMVFGTTASTNFPTTAGAYSTTLAGNYDCFVAKFSANGQSLLASTYIGGTGSDGLNNLQPLKYNYADDHRGEIIVDANDDVFVATVTSSNDFPTTPGTIQPASAGGNDGIIFKLSSNLNSLLFSSYIGGTGNDAAYSLQFSSTGEIFVTGGTTSNDFPTTAGVLNPTVLGNTDGWLMKINNTATSILASTYLGTANDYNQCYFVQLDTADNVYVVGQTRNGYPIFPATVYNNPSSGQFLHKLTNDLSTTVFSTCFGTGSGFVDIALSAFLVNECNYILISGWGGAVNNTALATNSTTNNLPITSNAIQPTTDGSDYYLVMFSENADTILYATYFGGNASFDHVDGGTSRFDKKGIVYQSVCASCFGATSDFPTTPGVWSNTDNSTNCNLGVFKLDLTRLTADAEVYTTPFYCIGDTVHFQNLSNGGVSYYWDFQDGNTSTDVEPLHVFDSAGTYHVMLVALDSISCNKTDTDYVDVFIGAPPTAVVNPVNGICKGDTVQLNASGGSAYYWSPNYNISDDSISNPLIWPDTTTLYTVIVEDSCGTDTTNILITVYQKNISVSPDTMICLGQQVMITASGGGSYNWQPAASLSNNSIANPVASPNTNTTYTVEITDVNGCTWDTTTTVNVDPILPQAATMNDTTICSGDSLVIFGSGGLTYQWTPTQTIAHPTDSATLAFPSQTTQYILEAKNGCGSDFDTLIVNVIDIYAQIVDDTSVCIGNKAHLWASGGESYYWSPTMGLENNTHFEIFPTITTPITYYVAITDTNGCETTLSVNVDTLTNPTINLGDDKEAVWGQEVQLNANSNGLVFEWTPPNGLSCTDCPNPIVTSTESMTYYLKVLGKNGCYSYDTINVYFDGAIYVPNSFTPDGDGINDVFYAFGVDIKEFEMYIFNRWGEKLFYSDDMENGWNGIYQGSLVKNDTYVWKVIYKDVLNKRGELIGTVTLIR